MWRVQVSSMKRSRCRAGMFTEMIIGEQTSPVVSVIKKHGALQRQEADGMFSGVIDLKIRECRDQTDKNSVKTAVERPGQTQISPKCLYKLEQTNCCTSHNVACCSDPPPAVAPIFIRHRLVIYNILTFSDASPLKLRPPLVALKHQPSITESEPPAVCSQGPPHSMRLLQYVAERDPKAA